ncbi:DUF7504 family protein [Natronobeatus ordinarius]|uniref:DUF7504 family protein n=1 Tax=Natronobeatus ordinarius TaxID=2963433 RepID=UPI0020CF9AAB|nr:hypothetical protein [Natronobeatus ordinarius]
MEGRAPTVLEPSSSVLFVNTGGTEPGNPRAIDPGNGDLAELTVTFPDQRAAVGTADDASVTRGVVAVGDVLQSVADSLPECSAPVAIDVISDPTDLGAIGVSVSRFCERWAGVDRIVVSVRSLERLLRVAPPEKAFRFVHALLARLEQVGATTYAAVDRSRFDDASEPLPEASDEDVAELFATPASDDPLEGITTAGSISEATDEELARRLEN